MTDAYVNVYLEAGAVTQAASEIGDLDAVSAVHLVTGEYDIVARIDVDEIHPVSGVIDTVTNVAFEP